MTLQTPIIEALVGFSVVFIISILFTRLIIMVSHRYQVLVPVRKERWHKQSKPYLGGIGIFISLMLGHLIFFERLYDQDTITIMVGASCLFLLGLIDDLFDLKAYIKFIYQFAIAIVVSRMGIVVAAIPDPLLALAITSLWIVAITNAFNLLDNMDGLSGGIAIICMLCFLGIEALRGEATFALSAAIFIGAVGGFLVFNFPPARLFMGDCGSLVLGFLLATYAIKGTWQQASNLFVLLATPVLLLCVPIFDTLVVSIERTLHRRPIYVGGRDHASHRLVAHGLTEKSAVLILYGISAAVGFCALLGVVFNYFITIQIGLLVVASLITLGVFLSDVPIYANRESNGVKKKGLTVLIPYLPHKRRLVEIVIDTLLIVVSYSTAYLLRFDWQISSYNAEILRDSLPILVPVKLITLLLSGMYSGFWKYIDFSDVKRIFLSTLVSSAAAVIVLVGIYRFSGFSRAVFVIDFMVFFLLAVGFRTALRMMRESFYGFTKSGQRVLIVGAGEAGQWVLQEIRKDRANDLIPVGIIDDDPWKKGRQLYGIPIVGNQDVIEKTVTDKNVSEIIVAIPSLTKQRQEEVLELCRRTGRPIRVLNSITSWSVVVQGDSKTAAADSDSSHTDDSSGLPDQADPNGLH